MQGILEWLPSSDIKRIDGKINCGGGELAATGMKACIFELNA